jgi:hypothetical protein
MSGTSIRASWIAAWLAVAALGLLAPAAAAQEELRNDGWSSGQLAAFQQGFVAGEIAAVRLVPSGPCPCPLSSVRFLFGGQSSIETVTLHVWDDSAGTAAPGAELFSDDFEIGGIDNALLEIDLSGRGVSVSGPFRVGIEFHHDGLPSVARDTDGSIAPGRNFILAQGVGWVDASVLGVPGDWILRAVVGGPTSTDSDLKNDGWFTGQTAAFQQGFVAGEIAAVRLVPNGPCPCPLSRVRFLFGGAPGIETITLHVWDDSGGTAAPGTELFSDDFEIGGIDEALLEIDLVGRGVTVNGPFRVGIEFHHDGLPSVARDTDGSIAPGRNFILAQGSGWVDSSVPGVPGDWIIRAVLGELPPASGELQNDGWFTGETAAFQEGFAPGEIAAVRLVPSDPCPCPLSRVRFLFGGAPGIETITLHVWDDSAGTPSPGTELYAADYEIGGIDEALLDLDLRPASISVNGPFRIGIELHQSGLPSVARDTDGTVAPGRNFVLDSVAGWVEASSLGVLGDWVLRAVLGPDLLPAELSNDGWQSGDAAVFQADLSAGDIAAVRLVPTGPCPCPISSARLLFGGATSTAMVTLHVWDDSAGTLAPGPELFSGDFALTGSDDALQEIDLRGAGLVIDGPVRVGIEAGQSGLPALARDADGVTVERNFVAPGGSGWSESSALGIPGDFVLRLVPEPAAALAELTALGGLGLLARRRRSRSTAPGPRPGSR